MLEKVQERAIRAVSGLKGRAYSDRLGELNLPTLAQRREEADLIMAYKILRDSDKDFNEQWFKKMDRWMDWCLFLPRKRMWDTNMIFLIK